MPESRKRIRQPEHSEDALRDIEQRCRTLVETFPDVYMSLDLDMRLTLINRQGARLLGYERPEELIGKNAITDILDEKDWDRAKNLVKDLLKSGNTGEPANLTGVKKDGSRFQGEIKASVILDTQKKPAGFIVVVRDITERKRVEEELRWKTAFLEAQVNASLDGILVVNSKSQKLLQNRRFAEIFKIPKDIAEDRDDRNQVQYVTNRAKNSEEFTERIIHLYSHPNETMHDETEFTDGTIVEGYSSPVFGQEGEYYGRIWIIRDITERKLAEERLKRYASELKRANEEVKEFAYIVSHDLRAPLVNMKGFAAELRATLNDLYSALSKALPDIDQAVQEKITDAFKTDIPEAIDFIDSSATRMDNFINALLQLSRMGRREMHFEPINLAEVVRNILKGLAHQIEEHRTKVNVGILPEVTGDRTAIEQIVNNLLTNAVNYLDPERPGEIEIKGERTEQEVTFSVRDNGRGIAKEDIAKVFMPFRRFGRQDVKGEGMGLAFVHTLVRRHGGNIRCESEPGAGTTFTVTLSNHPEQGG